MMNPTMTHTPADPRAHFGLVELPFTRELRIDKRMQLSGHDKALTALVSTVENRMSAALIGPAGSGKTITVRALINALPEARYRVNYLHVTSLSKRDFCRHLATAIGARPAGHTGALIAAIQQRACALTDQDALRPVLVIDEAHEMRPEVLGLLRLLTNFEVDSRLVLSIVLAGQPRLRTLLRRDELQAVRGRLAHVATLGLLDRASSRAYIQHRAQAAGATADLFDDAAYDAMYEFAQGNLRALNTIAFKTLYEAAAAGVERCTVDHVIAARAQVAA